MAMRKICADALVAVGFDGYGFGARPVDANGKFLGKVLRDTADMIPEHSLRFGLGIGLPEDIVRCVQMGWDIFDCVIPTREGRHGRLFLRKSNVKAQISNVKSNPKLKFQMSKKFYETLNINNAKFAKDFKPINKNSKLPELREYSRAYLHHLFKINDTLGQRLASLNNLEFYLDLLREIRQGIRNDSL